MHISGVSTQSITPTGPAGADDSATAGAAAAQQAPPPEPALSRQPTSTRPIEQAPAIEAIGDSNPAAEAVARSFYDAFTAQDFDTMESLYAPDVQFEDAIFEYGDRAGTMKMWRGISEAAKGMTSTYEVLGSEGNEVRVKWKADYEIGGRPVHNEVETTLTIEDGKVTAQRDQFPFAKWARQALPLGPFASAPGVQHAVTSVIRLFVNIF